MLVHRIIDRERDSEASNTHRQPCDSFSISLRSFGFFFSADALSYADGTCLFARAHSRAYVLVIARPHSNELRSFPLLLFTRLRVCFRLQAASRDPIEETQAKMSRVFPHMVNERSYAKPKRRMERRRASTACARKRHTNQNADAHD